MKSIIAYALVIVGIILIGIVAASYGTMFYLAYKHDVSISELGFSNEFLHLILVVALGVGAALAFFGWRKRNAPA